MPFNGEERILIEYPANLRFDETPEMSAGKVTDAILDNLFQYDFILANFANADMVGHTGNLDACVKAIEVLDREVGRIIPEIVESGGILIITADHGNIEEKLYKLTGEKRTKHSVNPVPFYLISKDLMRKEPKTDEEIKVAYQQASGTLTDVAPTVLELLGIPKPEEMTGRSLLNKLK